MAFFSDFKMHVSGFGVPGLFCRGGRAIAILPSQFLPGPFRMGEQKHINKVPPKIPEQFRENFVYVFFSLCVCVCFFSRALVYACRAPFLGKFNKRVTTRGIFAFACQYIVSPNQPHRQPYCLSHKPWRPYLLKLRSLGSLIPFVLSDNSIFPRII